MIAVLADSYDIRSESYHRGRLVGLDRYRTFSASIDSATYLRFHGGLTWPAVGRVDRHRDALKLMNPETVDVDAAVLATGPAVPATVAELGLTIPDATSVALLVRTPPVGTSLRRS